MNFAVEFNSQEGSGAEKINNVACNGVLATKAGNHLCIAQSLPKHIFCLGGLAAVLAGKFL
nr:hypothetical protein [Hymenobacter terricola]